MHPIITVLNAQGFVELINHSGSDQAILNAARVSYDGDQRNHTEAKDKKLIKYLLANKHTSPFEHVNFTFHIKAPIFVVRQWQRHRNWSYNEISARYTEVETQFYTPTSWRGQSKDNKQASEGTINDDFVDAVDATYSQTLDRIADAYLILLSHGVSREMARMILPVSTFTRFYATVDLHNLLHFIELREHPHSQIEIQEYARAMRELITPLVPWAMEAWNSLKEES
jgi:thymidylate synthase (FAD)